MKGFVELKVAVRRPDGGLLLPEKTPLSPGLLRSLIASNADDCGGALSLLRHGTVRRDLLDLLSQDPYRAIFDAPEETALVLQFMEDVGMIRPLLAMLDYFKQTVPETYQHILRVTALSTLIGRLLLNSDKEVRLTVLSAALHDFGKTCISPELLLKSDPLTRPERECLEQHTLAGYVLIGFYLRDMRALPARAARDHHERRDRSGYPRGIALRDRIIEIIAVSDIYDALVSYRPYRRTSYKNRRALEEITEMAAGRKIGWRVVKELISLHRHQLPADGKCVVSGEMRDVAPRGNVYGVVLDEDS